MNYVKMTCISITTPIISNIKLPQFYPEIENRVFSPVVLGDDREKVFAGQMKRHQVIGDDLSNQPVYLSD